MRLPATVLAVLLLLPAVASALSVVFVDLEELTRQSDAVVLGTVIEQRGAYLDEYGIEVNETRIAVEQTLRGTPPTELWFRTLGGAVPVPGVEQFADGERTVVFLRFADGAWWVTAMGQSKMTVTDGLLGSVATRQLHVSAYVRDDQGNLVAYRPPSQTVSLDVLAAAVR
ncbi:MAG: hypothetical protein GY898_15580 [Proteobacteria bacterium]|nr:hypothetical protein [Pseudomonadota bacterium]